ncbi:hypothetical protein ACOILA_004291 [Cronobacter sakazakii]
MAGVLASTAAAIGILDKAVSITQKLANNSDELVTCSPLINTP